MICRKPKLQLEEYQILVGNRLFNTSNLLSGHSGGDNHIDTTAKPKKITYPNKTTYSRTMLPTIGKTFYIAH